jgi:hypothetical protein
MSEPLFASLCVGLCARPRLHLLHARLQQDAVVRRGRSNH